MDSYSSKAFALTDQLFFMAWEILQTLIAIIHASKLSGLHFNFRHLLWREIFCINGTMQGFPLLDLSSAWNCWEHSLSREPSKVPISSLLHPCEHAIILMNRIQRLHSCLLKTKQMALFKEPYTHPITSVMGSKVTSKSGLAVTLTRMWKNQSIPWLSSSLESL